VEGDKKKGWQSLQWTGGGLTQEQPAPTRREIRLGKGAWRNLRQCAIWVDIVDTLEGTQKTGLF